MVICDLLTATLRALHPRRFETLVAENLRNSSDWWRDLGLDSLDRTSCALAVAEFFNVSESGEEDLLLLCRNAGQFAERVARSRELATRDLTFRTSGSTARPKRFRHSAHTLAVEAQAWARLIMARYGRPKRILRAVPTHHIYGWIWAIELANAFGLALPEQDFNPLRPTDVDTTFEGALVLATPRHINHWRLARIALPGACVVAAAGGFAQSEMAEPWRGELAQALLEVYGSTETAGLGFRFDPGPYFWLDHIQPVIENGRVDAVLRLDPGGRLDRLVLPDHVIPDRDDPLRRFELGGRRDHVIKVSGERIDLSELAAEFLRVPGVQEAYLRPIEDGADTAVSVLLVSTSESADLIEACRRLIADRPKLARAIAHWDVRPAPPLTETGKIADWTRDRRD
ncbi:MAG: AMP-binding protein [Casimicrobiaceae bacterium]